MSHLALVFLMQYVISSKAGLVNHVQGPANVAPTESITAGAPVKTGPEGFAEVLLNPGTFLRIGGNSEVVVENVELESIAVRIVSGTAVIEAAGVSRKQPITVTTRNLTTELIDSGIYVFENGKVSVLHGKLRTVDSKIEFKKGWQVDKNVAYRAVKLGKTIPSAVESWSQARSEIMASMNAQVMTTYQPEIAFRSDAWVFSGALGGYTFVPHRRYVSPYGRPYYAVGGRTGFADRESTSGITNSSGHASTGTTQDTGSGVTSTGSNPGNDRPAFRDRILEKNAPVEALVP
jgi:hypothetical protein